MRGGCALLGLLALAAACDPRDLDEAVHRAPVRSLGRPGGFPAQDLGRVVLALPPPPGPGPVAGRLLAAGAQRGSLALFELDPAGKATARNVTDPTVRDLLVDSNAPAGSAVLLASGKVLIGSPNHGASGPESAPLGRTLLLDPRPGPDGRLEFLLTRHFDAGTDQRRFGLAVAVGQVSGGPDEDQVVLSESQVALVEDGDLTRVPLFSNPGHCDIALERQLPTSYGFRAVAVADLAPTPGEEIAVGVPREGGGPGRVVVFAKVGAELACPITLTAPPAGTDRRPRFGAALATGDLDGDGVRELLVGAPPDRVLVYRAPLGPMAAPVGEIAAPVPAGTPGGDFGLRIAVMDVDGIGGPEIVVGAPDMSVDGKAGAGAVFVLRPDGTVLARLVDSSPEERGGFGLSLTEMRFAAPACDGRSAAEHRVLVVGADRELFAYFRVPGLQREPRCFGKTM